MTFPLNDKRLLKMSFVLALDNPELKRTPFFIFLKRGFFQTQKLLLLSQETSPKILFETNFTCIYVKTNVTIPSVIDSDPRRSISS